MIKKITIDGQECWQVQHGHEQKGPNDKPPGTPIKTYCGPGAEEKARKMHQAIIISQMMRDK